MWRGQALLELCDHLLPGDKDDQALSTANEVLALGATGCSQVSIYHELGKCTTSVPAKWHAYYTARFRLPQKPELV